MSHLGVIQGTIILYEDRFPKIIDYGITKEIKRFQGDYLYEVKRRPAVVISKEADYYGNRVIIPLTGRANMNTPNAELKDWINPLHPDRRSYAKVYDTKVVQSKDIIRILGYLTEDDLARVLFKFNNIF